MKHFNRIYSCSFLLLVLFSIITNPLISYCQLDDCGTGTAHLKDRMFTGDDCDYYSWSFDPSTVPSGEFSPNIPQAWTITQGQGIKVAVFDEYISSAFENDFNKGESNGRAFSSLSSIGYLGGCANQEAEDYCSSHATKVAGIIAGAKTNEGKAFGIAYKSDLIHYQVLHRKTLIGFNANVVILDQCEGIAVENALVNAIDSNVNIINMSIGTQDELVDDNGNVGLSDVNIVDLRSKLKVAYENNIVMFAAAGSLQKNLSVTFPGNSKYTLGVTGIDLNGDKCNEQTITDPSSINGCHSGPEVDFSVYIVNEDNRYPVTYAGQYFGLTSTATAHMSGMTALLWSEFPGWTKERVINQLILSSSNYPNKIEDKHGWGTVDIYKALTENLAISCPNDDITCQDNPIFNYDRLIIEKIVIPPLEDNNWNISINGETFIFNRDDEETSGVPSMLMKDDKINVDCFSYIMDFENTNSLDVQIWIEGDKDCTYNNNNDSNFFEELGKDVSNNNGSFDICDNRGANGECIGNYKFTFVYKKYFSGPLVSTPSITAQSSSCITHSHIEFYDELNATGNTCCAADIENGTSINFKDGSNLSSGCINDEAKSAILYNAKAGSVLKIYDDPDARTDKSWMEIRIKQNIDEYTINTFESNIDNAFVRTIFHDNNESLNGKVSRYQSVSGPTRSTIDFHDNLNGGGDLLCSVEFEDYLQLDLSNNNAPCDFNDKTESVTMYDLKKGTQIGFYDLNLSVNYEGDDWLRIKIKQGLKELKINSLELTEDVSYTSINGTQTTIPFSNVNGDKYHSDEYIELDFHYVSNLNDKLTSIEIFNFEDEGCTDATACNYDPNAVIEDGSCIFALDGNCGDPVWDSEPSVCDQLNNRSIGVSVTNSTGLPHSYKLSVYEGTVFIHAGGDIGISHNTTDRVSLSGIPAGNYEVRLEQDGSAIDSKNYNFESCVGDGGDPVWDAEPSACDEFNNRSIGVSVTNSTALPHSYKLSVYEGDTFIHAGGDIGISHNTTEKVSLSGIPPGYYEVRLEQDGNIIDSKNYYFENCVDLCQSDANNYYNNISNEICGEDLKTALFELINDHNQISYDDVWIHFGTTDIISNSPEMIIWDMYMEPNSTYADFLFMDNKCFLPNSPTAFGVCYQREHSFPKSYWGGGESQSNHPMFTDLFHIYPVDGRANVTVRNNAPYGEVDINNNFVQTPNGSLLGVSNIQIPGYSEDSNNKVFEPIDKYKGDFARTYFYMATRYEDKIGDWQNLNSNGQYILDGAFPAFQADYLEMLIRWHNEDSVSQKERDRNDAVCEIQGNRNPFIDHPEYVDLIWSECINNDPCETAGGPTLQVQINQTQVSDCIGYNLNALEATLTNGYPPFTYEWKEVATGNIVGNRATAENLNIGEYTVEVAGSAGCPTVTESFTIESSSIGDLNEAISHASCNKSDGSILLSVQGGTPPFTYQWDSVTGNQTTLLVTNLAPGSYTVTVTDSKGCTKTETFEVLENDCAGLAGTVCENAIKINSLPFSVTNQTTIGYGDDYYYSVGSCNGIFMKDNEIVYQYNTLGNTYLRLNLTYYNQPNLYYTSIYVLKGCPDDNSSTCIGLKYGFNPDIKDSIVFETLYLEEPGTYYFIVSSDSQPVENFELEIDYAYDGAVCENAIHIDESPFIYEGTTLGYGDDYNSSIFACTSTYISKNEIVFKYYSDGNKSISILVDQFSEVNHYAGVFIMAECPVDNSVGCIARSYSNSSSELLIDYTNLEEPGWYYIVLGSANNNNAIDDFRLTVCEVENPNTAVCQITTLDDLEEDCLNTVNTLHNDYACQYFCIADKTCEEYTANGENGWADGFVNYVWKFFESRNDGPLYQPNNCNDITYLPTVMDEYLCFANEGFLDHYFTEMAPAFFSYCNNCPIESRNVATWDNNHDAFLENAVVPCFTEFIDMPDYLSCATARNTEFLARLLRDVAQEFCINSFNANEGISDIFTSFTNDFVGGNLCCGSSAVANQFLGFEFYNACSDFDIIEVGQSVVEGVFNFINPFGGNQRVNPSDTIYFVDLDPQYYEITNGILTITGSPSPFAQVSPIVNIFSYVPQDSVITLERQFMITDIDNDGDLLGDDYESNIGLDPNSSNFDASADLDNDGINDFLEAIIQSNPLEEDSDNDGFSDAIEFSNNTDYSNELNYPSTNILTNDSFGNEYIEIHDFAQNYNQYVITGDFSNLNLTIKDFNDNVVDVLDNQQSSIKINLLDYTDSELKLIIQHLTYSKLYFETILTE